MPRTPGSSSIKTPTRGYALAFFVYFSSITYMVYGIFFLL
nr:MAG TPA: hypothetical protein [Caudoviricetes sp.]